MKPRWTLRTSLPVESARVGFLRLAPLPAELTLLAKNVTMALADEQRVRPHCASRMSVSVESRTLVPTMLAASAQQMATQ